MLIKFRLVVNVSILAVWFLWAPLGWAQACEDIFTNAVQSHSGTGNVTLQFRSVVSGGGTTIDTVNLSTENEVTCGGGTCQASGSPAATSTPTFVVGNGSDGNVNAAGSVGNNTNVSAGDYRSVSVVQRRQLSFTTANGLYLMESLSTNYQSGIRFSAGNYWIDGNLTIGQETVMELLGSGTVRIFVNGNVSFGFQAETSGFSPEQLLIYATGNITLANEVDYTGFLYAAGNVQANYRAEIDGAVSGANVTLANEVEVDYVQSVLSTADFAPFCSGGPPPAVLVGYWQMDEDTWSGTAGEVLDLSGNGLHGTATGATTDATDPALTGNPGTCGYGNFNGTSHYVTIGHDNVLNGGDGLSYSAWVNASTWSGTRQIMAKSVHGGGAGRAQMGIFSEANSLKARVETLAGQYEVVASLPPTDSWVHIAAVFEGNRLVLYVNGSQVAVDSFSNTQLVQTNDPLLISKRVGTSQYFFSGEIDEVRVHQGSLTQAQVSALASDRHECLQALCGGEEETTVGGLLGEYFNSTNFAGGVVGTRVDGQVDFNWAGGAPGVTGVNANQFSVEWNGFIRATQSGSYRFQTASDDGVRLYVDNNLLIERWNDHSVTTDTSASINLTAGQIYPVRLQFYENGGLAEIRLRWETPGGGGFVPIPQGTVPTLDQGLYYCQSQAVAYYTIAHGGTGVTCEAEPITITAFDATDTPIAPAAGTQLDLFTVPATGVWVGGSPYVFSGVESQIVLYLQQTTENTLNINLNDGTAAEIGSADPDITFQDVGIRFYSDASTLEAIPGQVAGEADPDTVLRVVEKDTDTGACVASVSDSNLQVGIGYECENPGLCVAGQTLTLNGNSAQPNNSGAVIAYNTANLYFDLSGFAEIPLEYSDVGQLYLHASIVVPASGNDPSVTATGSSNLFTVKPYTLVVDQVQRPDLSANPATTSAGSGFVPTGSPFRVVVEARNARGNPTPNFGNESPRQESDIALANLVYPAPGDPGALSNTGATSFVGANSGQFVHSSISWNQVGSVTMEPRLVGNDYLGAGDLVTYTESGTIGRFFPNQFVLTTSQAQNSCTVYSYMDEPAIALDYTLQAQGQGIGVVSNYDSAIGYADTASVSYVAEDNNDGTELSARVTADSGDWIGGVMNVSLADVVFSRDASIEAPMTDLQLGLRLTDNLDSRVLDALDMNPATSGDCVGAGNCSAKALGNTLELRYGRLNLASAYGPESLNLPVPFTTEFYNGVRWQVNLSDSCTEIARSAINYPAGTIDTDANRQITVGSGSSTGQYPGFIDADSVDMLMGEVDHFFSAPGDGNTGVFDVTIDLTATPWLQFNWDTGPNDEVTGSYQFGSYRGHDRILYWREVLQ
ncbi:PA14 domain-containing protein [Gilvimarinus sp. SDUM040013]|uniref:DUF6701 domain-containing protein n=1 Tax=Gilvimarinus gilvus TaxID=3058038 RepID=A0ABU4RXN5_9GAMM|nr:DUF6701 domain-containing protein [Gilvimarinus sp. SDUM040013]MDO3388169.1 PA14 domain-containing protein [Gilvimarinus sp. SDUM040013]MDX6847719.1 DUF6701 domain-containing protein [Gilvimarinus sp. SDUM040013]